MMLFFLVVVVRTRMAAIIGNRTGAILINVLKVSVSFEDELEENTSEQTKSPLSSTPSSASSSPHYR